MLTQDCTTPLPFDGTAPADDEAELDAYARGWNAGASVLGNPKSSYLHPSPGYWSVYSTGYQAAYRVAGQDLPPLETVWSRAYAGKRVR